MSGFARRRDIDGLRAIAVGSVIAFHAWPNALPKGFLGVDIFFVISGYLITGILARDAQNDAVSIARFYERRARRILPALIAMLAVTGFAAFTIFTPQDLVDFCHSAIAVSTFTANIWFWIFTNNYFAPTSDTIPLLHTWSLGVEEQFYLVFPIIFIFRKLRTDSNLRWLVGAGVVGSFTLSAWLASRSPGFQFYNLPPRAWELGIGSIVALTEPKALARRFTREIVAFAGLVLIGVALGSRGVVSPPLDSPGLRLRWRCHDHCCGHSWLNVDKQSAFTQPIGWNRARFLFTLPLALASARLWKIYIAVLADCRCRGCRKFFFGVMALYRAAVPRRLACAKKAVLRINRRLRSGHCRLLHRFGVSRVPRSRFDADCASADRH